MNETLTHDMAEPNFEEKQTLAHDFIQSLRPDLAQLIQSNPLNMIMLMQKLDQLHLWQQPIDTWQKLLADFIGTLTHGNHTLIFARVPIKRESLPPARVEEPLTLAQQMRSQETTTLSFVREDAIKLLESEGYSVTEPWEASLAFGRGSTVYFVHTSEIETSEEVIDTRAWNEANVLFITLRTNQEQFESELRVGKYFVK